METTRGLIHYSKTALI
ncbi:hypothetical protein PO124_31025 [Bacillus licheniformis]|nr:hypothetical protein [Bacillus licheniformis]